MVMFESAKQVSPKGDTGLTADLSAEEKVKR